LNESKTSALKYRHTNQHNEKIRAQEKNFQAPD
jgi:hypothetical protein